MNSDFQKEEPIFGTFRMSTKKAKKLARYMYDYINPDNKPILEEKEILEIFKIAYLGIRTDSNISLDEIQSYLSFHGSRHVPGKMTYQEFEDMVVRLLTLSENQRLIELNKKREEMRVYKETLKQELTQEIGPDIVENEIRYGMSLFEKYDLNKNGYLEDFEIPQILIDTYEAMKVEYTPTTEDIQNYIKMMDIDEDGKISRTEYELFLLQALHNRGVKVDSMNKMI